MEQRFDERGARMEEMIEVLRALWRGGMVEHHGEHYDFDRLEMSPVPPGPVPIYVGGTSEVALRRAAGSATAGSGCTTRSTSSRRSAAFVRTERAEVGRGDEPFDLVRLPAGQAPTPRRSRGSRRRGSRPSSPPRGWRRGVERVDQRARRSRWSPRTVIDSSRRWVGDERTDDRRSTPTTRSCAPPTDGCRVVGVGRPASGCSTARSGCSSNETYRDLKVVDIAREAGTSPATFYQYFPDVEDGDRGARRGDGRRGQRGPHPARRRRTVGGRRRLPHRRTRSPRRSSDSGTTTGRSCG